MKNEKGGDDTAFQSVFKRYELKYMITTDEKRRILKAMSPYMKPDEYGKTTVRNIYFDTDNYLLIRRSAEKPVYKEKMRVRSYSKANAESTVFVELKKKYNGVVFKRRVDMSEKEALDWVIGKEKCRKESQITREIDYFMNFYGGLLPKAFISYEREAYFSKDDGDFRITFDENILCRENDISLESEIYGTPVLPDGKVLMEIKCGGGIPLWLTSVLSKEKIYKTSFSKYGAFYGSEILPKLSKEDFLK